MARVDQIGLTEQWLIDHARDVCMNDAWLLVQGAPASGFARITSGTLEMKLAPADVTTFVPDRYWDVRMFGEIGEYHCWLGSDRKWRARFARRPDPDWKHTVTRSYPLWGTLSERDAQNGWRCLQEARGTMVWVPPGVVPNLAKDQPVLLNALLRIDREDDTGVAGVVDAMLCSFSLGRQK